MGRVASRPLAACSSAARNAAGSSAARGGRLGGRERDAAGRGDADRRRAADRHVADAVRDLTPGAAGDVALLLRQRELVDEHDLAGQDLDGAHAQARAAGPAALAGGPGSLVCPLLDVAHRALRAQVPWSQEARYLACSSVSVSQSTLMRLELEPGDLVVDVLGHHVDLVLEARVVLDHELGAERLVGEAHVHDRRRVTLGRRQVDQPAFGQQVDAAAVGHGVLLDELAHRALLHRELLERRDVDLDVEVAGVGDDGAVLHGLEVLAAQHVDVAGGGDEELGDLGGLGDRHDAEAVHDGLERAQRVDLEHDDVGAVALHAHGEAAAAPAVAGDADGAAGDEDVGGADDAVERALAGAVAVVEHVLGVGLVDGDDREHEAALGLEGLEADDAGGGLFGAADDVGGHVGTLAVQHADDVGAVVHGDVGPVVDAGVDVRVVGRVVLALDGVDAHAVVVDQRGGDVVLRAQRVAGAEHHVGAAGDQGAHEAGGLGGDVQAGADAHALERLLLLEALADGAQHGHVHVGPLDAQHALGGESDVFDVVVVAQVEPHSLSYRGACSESAGGQSQAVVRGDDGGGDQGVGHDAAAPLPDRPRLEAREAAGVGDARRHDAGRVYPSPMARTNVGRLIYAGHAGEVARHAGRPAAGERAAPLQPHVIGHGDEVAGGGPLPRVARPQHGHDEPDDAPARLRGEEREQAVPRTERAGAAAPASGSPPRRRGTGRRRRRGSPGRRR